MAVQFHQARQAQKAGDNDTDDNSDYDGKKFYCNRHINNISIKFCEIIYL
jgi:hypothetical protein